MPVLPTFEEEEESKVPNRKERNYPKEAKKYQTNAAPNILGVTSIILLNRKMLFLMVLEALVSDFSKASSS